MFGVLVVGSSYSGISVVTPHCFSLYIRGDVVLSLLFMLTYLLFVHLWRGAYSDLPALFFFF